ncbi:sterol desaturase family protein [Parvularcula sp. IMCC14364]|uniref:sterol desaturase family protein n=1 Tax=Parvularcula sp. IMCC14364 TaxID=3067902 RepID=UPI0027419051|nr:sterol desaturase family protein [Parvularcula sp. IMCC14364]
MLTDFLSPIIGDWPVALRWGAIAGVVFALIAVRYFLVAGTGFGISTLLGKIAPWRRLQNRDFSRQQIMREIAYSMLSTLIFVAVVGLIFVMTSAGWTQLYTDPYAYGLIWLILQVPVVLLIQDFYFYWMHRIVHEPAFYNRVHKTHHLSTNPSPFSAFAFHPFEAVLEIAILLVLVFIIPLHAIALITAGLLSLVYNVYGHLGYEVMPRFLANSPFGYWLNKSAYHNQHHRTYRYNYGLYTVIWDRLYGTLHPKADQLYDQATQKPEKEPVIFSHEKSISPATRPDS